MLVAIFDDYYSYRVAYYIAHKSNGVDSLTMIMLVIITSVSTLVHLYSSQYMATDPHLSRFMSYLSLFIFLCLY